MANSQHDPVVAQVERQKLTLIASIKSVAEQMRHCANVADQFTQMLTQAPFGASLVPPGATHAGSKRHGTEEEGIEGAIKKRRTTIKKARDPDAPKRAASSYIFFQNDLRQELRKQHPDISSTEIMARVKKQWADMTPEDKAPYEHLQAEAKHKWEEEKRAYDERRGIVAPTRPVSRKTAAATVEKPTQPTTVGLSSTKLAQKTPESSDSSIDTNSSDKSSGEEDGTGGDSGEEDDEEKDEELPASPLPSKGRAKRKAEIVTATSTKPKGQGSSSAGPIPARPEKKKRSKV
ncbi:hypothetical protein BJV77DRAFT_768279 [Russula vinacea]|nr:hypothetical protein BJV77DRAFT_768279 [Russula vinacea]